MRAKGRGQRAKGEGQRAEGKGQRAKGRGQRAEGRGQRAEGRLLNQSNVTLSPDASGVEGQSSKPKRHCEECFLF